MDHSPYEKATGFSPSQGISLTLWNAKFHCRVKNSPSIASTQSLKVNPVYNLPFHFFKILLNTIPLFTSRFSKLFFLRGFPTKILYALVFSSPPPPPHTHT